MVGTVGSAASLVTIWIWWPHGGFVLGAAIVLGVVNWWCLGIMHNVAWWRTASLRGKFWDHSIQPAQAAKPVAASLLVGTFVAQTVLLVWGTIQSNSIIWWQALLAVIVLSTVLIFSPRVIVWIPLLALVLVIPLLALVLVLIRACG